jgi:hypothetical protein
MAITTGMAMKRIFIVSESVDVTAVAQSAVPDCTIVCGSYKIATKRKRTAVPVAKIILRYARYRCSVLPENINIPEKITPLSMVNAFTNDTSQKKRQPTGAVFICIRIYYPYGLNRE